MISSGILSAFKRCTFSGAGSADFFDLFLGKLLGVLPAVCAAGTSASSSSLASLSWLLSLADPLVGVGVLLVLVLSLDEKSFSAFIRLVVSSEFSFKFSTVLVSCASVVLSAWKSESAAELFKRNKFKIVMILANPALFICLAYHIQLKLRKGVTDYSGE